VSGPALHAVDAGSTVEGKKSVYEQHLKAVFGHLRLDRVGVAEIASFRASLVEKNLNDKTINNILAVLSKENGALLPLLAGIIEITTAIMEQGRNILRRSNRFLAKFMSEQGYKSTAEIIGIAQQYIEDLDKVDFQAGNIVSETDMEKCTNCGICADGFCICRTMVDGKLVVDIDNCSGCGGCLASCHSVHAITLKQKVVR